MKMVHGCTHIIAKISTVFAVLGMTIISLSGCVREDESDCPVLDTPGITLKYKYDMNMEYADRFADKVENLQAFIFNSNGVLCDTLTPFVGAGTIVPGWERTVNLNPGTYSVVTWAGSDNFYNSHYSSQKNSFPEISEPGVIIGVTKLEDFRMFLAYDKLNEDGAQPRSTTIKDLYHGFVGNITVAEDNKTVVNTSLIKNNNNIKITITGIDLLSSPVSSSDFEFLIQSRNGHYKFDNNINEEAHLINYTPFESVVINESLVTQIHTMRLTKPNEDPFGNGKMVLSIKYKPTNIFICKDVDLVDLILSGRVEARDSEGKLILDENNAPIFVQPSLDYLDRQDLFEIKYEIIKDENDKLIMTVYVNDWKIANIYPVKSPQS